VPDETNKEQIAALGARGEQIKTNSAGMAVASLRAKMKPPEPPVYRFDIGHSVNDAPPPRRHSNPQECAPGYLWNSTTQELIPILTEDHPDYRQNQEIITEAIRRWSQGASR
jgi:hypothetical protein